MGTYSEVDTCLEHYTVTVLYHTTGKDTVYLVHAVNVNFTTYYNVHQLV